MFQNPSGAFHKFKQLVPMAGTKAMQVLPDDLLLRFSLAVFD
jgi:hypothetical protein